MDKKRFVITIFLRVYLKSFIKKRRKEKKMREMTMHYVETLLKILHALKTSYRILYMLV